MPTYLIFIISAILLVSFLAVVILVPWIFYQKNRNDNQLLALNIEVFQQRLAELKNDFKDNQIDEKTYQSQKLSLERQLLDIDDKIKQHYFVPSRKSQLIFLLWIPCLVAMAYFMIADRSDTIKFWQAKDKLGQVADDLLTGKNIKPPPSVADDPVSLIQAMQSNVHENATDPMRWYQMSRVYDSIQAPKQAIESLSRAYRLKPDDEQIAIGYAQTSFFAEGGVLTANIRQVLNQLLAKNPNHQGAQMLMAMGEIKEGNYQEARKWVNIIKQAILAQDGDHSEAINSLTQLQKNIDEKESQSQQAISVHVQITTETLGRVKKGDTLFINIRPISGGMPVAVKKMTADTLTKEGFDVKISDNDSIMPTSLLSQALALGQPLGIVARISSSGDAMPKTGDLTSGVIPVDKQTKRYSVIIDKMLQ